MKTHFEIEQFLEDGKIQNELDFERALIADRKLRVLSKEDPTLKDVRKKLRDLLEAYEIEHWSSGSNISDQQLHESDLAETSAEKERLFLHDRKKLIRTKLKILNLSQQDFGVLLGHNSKSYMSELMNGVSPFSLKDLVVISKLLSIDLKQLVPTFLPHIERVRIKSSIEQLQNPKLEFKEDDFVFA